MLSKSVIVLLAIVGCSVFAEPQFTFPEIARERSPSRIVSGWEAEEGQFPHQLSLRMINNQGGVNACGGSIIHSDWGLTAAHCTATRTTFVVRAGTVNLTRPAFIFETTEFYNHPLYNDNLQSVVQPHDIALLRFGLSLTFTDLIKPIRVQRFAERDRNYENRQLTASGWGRTWTAPDGVAPENMNWVYLQAISNLDCWTAYMGSSIIIYSTICTLGYNETTQSTCSGDSGGPLTVYEEDGELTQIGVTSFVSGQGCHAGLPSGFIRPGHYHDWFTQITNIDFDWELVPTTTAPTTTEATTTESTTTTEAPTTTEATTTEGTTTTEEPTTTDATTTEGTTTTEEPTTTDATTTEGTTTTEAPTTTEATTTEGTTTTEEPTTTDATTTEGTTTTEAPTTTEATTTEGTTTTEEPTTTDATTTEGTTTTEAPTTTEATTTEGTTTTEAPTTIDE